MKAMVMLGAAVMVAAMLGCSSSGVAEGQPKNVDPNAHPNVHRAAVNGAGGGATKAAAPIGD